MCGRFSFSDIDKFFYRYSIKHPIMRLEPHYNVAPGMRMPVVVQTDEREAIMMRWGLVPSWAKDPKIGYKMINARAETVAQKPSFRRAFATQRCLVPATTFFEWQDKGEVKIPYAIRVRETEIFSLAGLYDSWKDPEGHKLQTFTIITCEPNSLMQPIHDRMPVILKRADEDAWLDRRARPDLLTRFLRPYPSAQMEACTVSRTVNDPKNDDPSILIPFAYPAVELSH